jgi:eukaryotic-like serine/threonine-protein kinase
LQSVDLSLSERGESPPTESALRRRLAATRWPEVVCWLGARMAAALDYAHAQGILHRDVKPANVLLTAEGSPKLADFNVSFSSKVEGATPAAYFGGSLAYMSPEQLEASNPNHERNPEELDGRSDLFSLAVMLWELLTGARPFGDEHFEGTWVETLERLTERRLAGVPQESIDALPRDLPPGMKEVLLSCLSPYGIDRPATGAVLARRLELCLQPRAQRLFRPKALSLETAARYWPLKSLVAIVLVVNVVFSGFNILFNFKAEVEKLEALGHYDVVDVFKHEMVVVVNAVTYPVGTIIGLLLAWPVLRAVRLTNEPRLTGGNAPAASPVVRTRVSTLPDYLGWMTAALWFVSGFWFAAWIHHEIAAGGKEAERNLYAHFVPTQILWGLVACTQVFFLMATLVVRAFWPALLDMGHPEPTDAERLWRLQQRAGWYFGLAILAPFIALYLVATSEDAFRVGAGMLAGIGGVCCLIAWFLFRLLQRDVGALGAALEPKGESIGGAGTESFWAVSR